MEINISVLSSKESNSEFLFDSHINDRYHIGDFRQDLEDFLENELEIDNDNFDIDYTYHVTKGESAYLHLDVNDKRLEIRFSDHSKPFFKKVRKYTKGDSSKLELLDYLGNSENLYFHKKGRRNFLEEVKEIIEKYFTT